MRPAATTKIKKRRKKEARVINCENMFIIPRSPEGNAGQTEMNSIPQSHRMAHNVFYTFVSL